MEITMSAINKALSNLTSKPNNSHVNIEQAVIPKVRNTSPIVWIGVGILVSLAMGSWAFSTANMPPSMSVPQEGSRSLAPPRTQLNSPTANLGSASSNVFDLSKAKLTDVQRVSLVKDQSKAVTTMADMHVLPSSAEPILLAQLSPNKVEPQANGGEMVVEQVELSSEQLAEKAIQRAKKSIDANDINGALENYTAALRYAPENEQVRQRLSALYYGKGQTRKSYELLQEGINRNPSGERLRLALTKLLIKENQQEAALTPLVYLPEYPSIEYLSLRAGLAQRNKQADLAYQSYELLTQQDGENARWWMGLAIQQERKMEFSLAKNSYENALEKIGVSSQSKAFIRDRLKVIENLEGSNDAN
ncbi:MSHA biogenesis protein MshN [Vibrio mediterranei]|nr:MSHA biogenesis protein MshN [Vibrio mediterranei]